MDLLSKWWTTLGDNPVSWPLSIAAGLGLAAMGLVLERPLYRLLHWLTLSTTTHLDDLLVKRMRPAARTLVVLGVVHLVLQLRGDQYPQVRLWISVVEWLLVAYLMIEGAETLVFDWYLAERRNIQVPEVLRQVVLVSVYFAAGLSILGSLAGLSLAPFLATGSVLTVVLGLALQDTLGNLFAGLALHAESPFTIGDWIQADGVDGQVVNAGWRSTQLKTLSGDLVSIPNAALAKARSQNFNRPDQQTGRNVEFLALPSASPEAVERACRAALARVPNVLADHPRTKFWFVAIHPLYQRWILRCWISDYAAKDDVDSNLRKALWHTLREEGLALDDGAAVAARDVDRPDALAVPPRIAG